MATKKKKKSDEWWTATSPIGQSVYLPTRDKKLREKKLEENLEATLAEDRLAEIQEARLNKVDESVDAIKNTEVDIDKELGPEVRTNNQMLNLGLMSQPQGEENATNR